MLDFGNAGVWTRELLDRQLFAGAHAIDATMGNGHDTLYLAQRVTAQGHVWAFDVQEKALENTRARLEANDLADAATLILDDHANMETHVRQSVDAVVFNLGWLPGQAHAVTTKADSTLRALTSALRLLKVGGLMTVCVYPGHAEGQRELEAVCAFMRALDDRKFDAVSRGYENIRALPPRLFAVVKKQ